MTRKQVAELARHIPDDEFPRGVENITPDEWFVVGPRCLELWWQFKGPRFPAFTDPYVRKIISSVGRKP